MVQTRQQEMEALQQQLAALTARMAELTATNADLQRRLDERDGNPPPPPPPARAPPRLPPFSAERPALWFAQVDGVLGLAGFADEDTKYQLVVAQLETRYAAEVEDLILRKPAERPFTALKDALVSRLSASEGQRLEQLLGAEHMGDRKPSQFLRHLQGLAGTVQIQDSLLRRLWMRGLPASVQAILSVQAETDIAKLAILADKVVEVVPTTPAVCATTASNPLTTLESRLDDVMRQVAAIAASAGRESRPRSRSRSRSRPRSPSPNSDLCFYHYNFKGKARKCLKPCSWTGNGASGQ